MIFLKKRRFQTVNAKLSVQHRFDGLQVVRTSFFWSLPLSVKVRFFFTVFKWLPRLLTKQTPTIHGIIQICLHLRNAVSKDHTSKRNSFNIGLPPFLVDQSHSFEERSWKGIEPLGKNTTNPALYCFIIPKISFSLLDTCNKSSNQKYPASLKHFSEIGLLGCEICYFDDDGSVTLTSGQADIVRDTKFLVEEGMHRHLKRRSGYRGNPQKWMVFVLTVMMLTWIEKLSPT